MLSQFIKKEDGHKKQDCENAAVKRWLKNNHQKQYEHPVTLLGDDLYSRENFFSFVLYQK